MSRWKNELFFYMQYPFVRYALIVSILITLCSSLLGVSLVLKRFSFIGDGLSHIAFGAMSVATLLKLSSDSLLTIPITILAAIFLLCTGQHSKLRGDSAVALLSVSALAIGYFTINLFSASANVSGDVCSTLFGAVSILTLSANEAIFCMILSLCVILFYILFYNRIFAVTFDENFAKATGRYVPIYNLFFAVITAIIIVLAMNLVGSLLVSALIVFPPLSAMRLIYSFRGVVLFSALLAVIGTLSGMLISILAATPVGSTIVVTDLFIFLCSCLIEKILRRG